MASIEPQPARASRRRPPRRRSPPRRTPTACGGGGAATQRPRGPRSLPPTCVAATSVPGCSAASAAASAIGSTVATRARSVVSMSASNHTPRAAHTDGSRAAAALRVAGGGRVEPVRAEHLPGDAANSGPEDVAERDGAPAGLDHDDGLRGRQLAAPAPGDRAQRLRDRLDRAEVGAGADDDLGARARAAGAPPGRGGARRSAGRTRWVTSLAPIMITATSAGRRAARSTCAVEVAAAGADRADVVSRTGRPAHSATPGREQHARASGARARRRSPTALESPSMANRIGSPAVRPCRTRPSALGGVGPGLADRPAGQRDLGAAAGRSAPPPSSPTPPPPYAAATAIRRARDARLTARLSDPRPSRAGRGSSFMIGIVRERLRCGHAVLRVAGRPGRQHPAGQARPR